MAMSFAASSRMTARPMGASKRMVASKATSGSNSTPDYVRSLPGISAPFPNVFDPLNLSATASIKDMKRWRESEITHGRVSMLAAVGFIVQENIQENQQLWKFGGKITGPAIYHFQQIKQGFWEPLLILIGIAEAYRVAYGWAPPVNGENFNALRDDYEPGELGFDPLGFAPKEPAALKELQTKELNNGRLAMIAVAGFVVQELLFQKDILTVSGFKEAMDEQPLNLSEIKRPPLPVEFPDRGLPKLSDIKAPALPNTDISKIHGPGWNGRQ